MRMVNLIRISRSTGWHQSLNRSAICGVRRSHQLMQTLMVAGNGRIEVTSVPWEDYWGTSQVGLTCHQAQQLRVLESARLAYIAAGHDLTSAPSYCHAYFAFLRDLLSGPTDELALRALLGLESFTITCWAYHSAHAAGALTIRHPVYLLAKLREPKAYDDSKFLPLVCPHFGTSPGSAPLFYNYHRIQIQNDPSASLRVYPAVDVCRRTESFACIEAISAALSFKPDPRSQQRAIAICDWAIAPFLKHQMMRDNAPTELSFVDIGGGSGALLSEVYKRSIKNHREMLTYRKFVWSIVDLGLQDVTRRTCSRDLRQHMSYINYQPADYITWIAEESARSDC